MEFKRDSLIALYLAAKPQVTIVSAPSSILMWINLLFLVPLLATVILAVLHRVQKVDKKNGNNTRND